MDEPISSVLLRVFGRDFSAAEALRIVTAPTAEELAVYWRELAQVAEASSRRAAPTDFMPAATSWHSLRTQ